jgi:hypothetical protein
MPKSRKSIKCGDTGNNFGTVYEFQEKPRHAWNYVAVLKIGGMNDFQMIK